MLELKYDVRDNYFAYLARDDLSQHINLNTGANVNESNRVGYTPLHVAAQRGSCLKELLHRNADVHATNRTFSTPLHLAARGGHVECVKALCEAGSDVSACDADQNTPMHFACWRNDRNIIQLLIRYGGSGLFSSSSSSSSSSDLSSYYDY